MIPYVVKCAGCGTLRVGTERGAGVEAYEEACPECGETEFWVPERECSDCADRAVRRPGTD